MILESMDQIKEKKKYIELTPDIIDILVSDKDEYDAFLKALREGTTDKFFERDRKYNGGIVGSLMDKDIRQPRPMYRLGFSDGGMTRDEEIAFHMFIVNMTPKGPSDAYAVEQSRDWLLKNLTPAEQRQMDFPR